MSGELGQLDEISTACGQALFAAFGPLFGLSAGQSEAMIREVEPLILSALSAMGAGAYGFLAGADTELDYYTDYPPPCDCGTCTAIRGELGSDWRLS